MPSLWYEFLALRASAAGAARTENGQFMRRRFEAAGQNEAVRAQATFQFVNAAALKTRKMVMMGLTGHFVSRSAAGQLDAREVPIVE